MPEVGHATTADHGSTAHAHLRDGPARLIIGGRDVAAQCGRTMPVYDPATGDVIAEVPAGDAQDVDEAVRAARKALDGAWSKLTPVERESLLFALADRVAADETLLAELETLNNGKPLHVARRFEVGASATWLRYMAGWTTKIEGSTIDVSIQGAPGQRYKAMTRKEPVGVVGAITPWNFPLSAAVWKVAPALAAGCTVVLKPSEDTPLTALRLVALAREVGFPDGVLNIVTGTGPEAGAALSQHPGVDKLAFTGSTATGKMIGHAAVDNLSRVTLELGGKSPMVMFADMDPALIAFAAQFGTFLNQGQVCTCGSRLLVQRPIFDKVVDAFAEFASTARIGSGFDPENQINALVSKRHQERVLGLIDRGVSDGARVVTGGEAAGDIGYYVKPTVLVDVDRDNTLFREEVFGPVVVAVPFDDFDEAVRIANDTDYGLAASVWSRDLSTVFGFGDAVKAGTVWANAHNMLDPAMPFGGYKHSGVGREHGRAGIEGYLETKSFCIAY